MLVLCPEATSHGVLPLHRRGGAKLVYACEWNPNAIGALRFNLLVNGVENRCIVLEGDNRLTAPKVHLFTLFGDAVCSCRNIR